MTGHLRALDWPVYLDPDAGVRCYVTGCHPLIDPAANAGRLTAADLLAAVGEHLKRHHPTDSGEPTLASEDDYPDVQFAATGDLAILTITGGPNPMITLIEDADVEVTRDSAGNAVRAVVTSQRMRGAGMVLVPGTSYRSDFCPTIWLLPAVLHLADRPGEAVPVAEVSESTRPRVSAAFQYGVIAENFNQAMRDTFEQMAAGQRAARERNRRRS